MKKFNPYFLIIFIALLVAIPIYWLVKGESPVEQSTVEARPNAALQPKSAPNLQRALNLIEKGNIREGTGILINLFTAASFVEKIEQATSDQFPLRMPIIQFSKAFERVVIKIAYSVFNDPAIPADMTTNVYFDSENNQLHYAPTLFNETTLELIDQRIKNYEELIQKHPDKKFYLYYHQTVPNSEFHPINQYFADADKGQSLTYFENHLPDELKLEKFMLSSMEDHLNYYYRTDHHWNVHGVLRSYEETYHLLSQNYPEISPMLENKQIVEFPEIEFLGRMARITFYPIEGDDFAVEDIEVPSHELIYSGQKVKDGDRRRTYFEGDYSMIPYVNHFNEFYGNVTDLIEYTFDNDAERNLLIIGSSFRYALDPLLASHYKKTYCIDLRYYTDFSLSDFLVEHEVDDILIVGDNAVAFDNVDNWTIKP